MRERLAWLVSLMGVRMSMHWNGSMQFIRAWLRRVSLHGDDLAQEVRTTVFKKDCVHIGK